MGKLLQTALFVSTPNGVSYQTRSIMKMRLDEHAKYSLHFNHFPARDETTSLSDSNADVRYLLQSAYVLQDHRSERSLTYRSYVVRHRFLRPTPSLLASSSHLCNFSPRSTRLRDSRAKGMTYRIGCVLGSFFVIIHVKVMGQFLG